MASIRNHTSTDVTKLLLVGDSGSGKTATLATLANAGYNLRILDFDDGLAILPEFLLDSAVDRVSFVTLRSLLTKLLNQSGEPPLVMCKTLFNI